MGHIVISEHCMYAPNCDVCIVHTRYQISEITVCMGHNVKSEYCMYGQHCVIRVLYL